MQFWLFIALVLSFAGQAGGPSKRPEGWNVRLDRPGVLASEPFFETMAPGWHITTGPSILAYQPGTSARGNFKLDSEILLFPDGQNEGYGLFIGGSSLESNELSYTAFQLRRDGTFSIWYRKGATVRSIVPWTPHPAIVPYNAAGPVKNLLTVDAGADEVVFRVNGKPVNVARRQTLIVDGNFGFRVHENLNIHPATLSLH
jgi:hypothetical protein